MTPQKRELILMVADGNMNTLPILHQLDGFIHSERMFKWLIQNKITGTTFLEYYSQKFQHSWLTFGKWITMKVNGEAEFARVIAGKNYQVK